MNSFFPGDPLRNTKAVGAAVELTQVGYCYRNQIVWTGGELEKRHLRPA